MRLAAAIFTLLTLASPAFAQSDGEERRYFRDWLAACRSDGYCSATAYQNANPGGGAVADYILRIGRHAEGTYWEISFTTIASLGDPEASFVVAVGDDKEQFTGATEVAAYGAVNDFFLMGPKAQAVMDRLVPGTTIAVDFTDLDATPQHAEFSLAGLTASLIWIDEVQRRLGSERVAEAPPVGLDPAGEIAVDATSDSPLPPTLIAQHEADTECGSMGELVNGADMDIDLELAEGRTLYILPCWSAPYNFGWKAYVGAYDEFAVQAFPEFSPSTGWSATTHLVNYAYDPATKQITTFNKGRGMADCGTSGTWQWSEYGFSLVEFRAKEDCDGLGEPGEFPVVYRRD